MAWHSRMKRARSLAVGRTMRWNQGVSSGRISARKSGSAATRQTVGREVWSFLGGRGGILSLIIARRGGGSGEFGWKWFELFHVEQVAGAKGVVVEGCFGWFIRC